MHATSGAVGVGKMPTYISTVIMHGPGVLPTTSQAENDQWSAP